MQASKYLIGLIATLFLTWVMLACFNIQFTSVYGNQVFLFFLSLLILAVWVIRSKSNETKMIILGSAIALYTVLYGIVSFLNQFLPDEDRQPIPFKNTDLLIYRQSEWNMAGPYMNIGGGKTYLWGLLYKKEFYISFPSEGLPPPISGAFTLPKELKDPRGRDCWLWEERGWLFDFDTKTLYQLTKSF